MNIPLSRRHAIGLMAGTAAGLAMPGPACSQAATIGAWSQVYDLGIIPIHLILLPNRKVLALQDDNLNYPNRGSGYVVGSVINIPTNGAPGNRVRVENTLINLFCSGHTLMRDGRVFFTGGNDARHDGAAGSTIFDYRNNSWETNISLPHDDARWYGTAITLASGEVLTVAGWIDGPSSPNRLPQIWSSVSAHRDLAGALRSMEYYPALYTAPNGRVFRAGPEQQCLWLNTSGTGNWSNAPSKSRRRMNGPTAMYAAGRIIALGGGVRTSDNPTNPADNPTNTAETINLGASSPAWRPTGSMKWPRRHASAVVLPDGTVLAVGGTRVGDDNDASFAVLEPELWNSSTGNWTPLAPMVKPRVYHSTAMLLPDARVIAAGGGRGSNADSELNCEILSPPYLFKGARPTISAPSSIRYGTTFTVLTSDAARIARVCLIRLGSVTHTINFNQRRVTLTFMRGPDSLAVNVPTNRSNLPPGHYMLFVVDNNGVPCTAPIVRVTSA